MPTWTRYTNEAPFKFIRLKGDLCLYPRYEVIDRSLDETLGTIYRTAGSASWHITGDPVGPPRFHTRAAAARELYHRRMGGPHGNGDIS